MSIIKKENAKKWINALVAIVSILIGYIVIRFLMQMGEWFNLESQIDSYAYLVQGIGVFLGLSCFLLMLRSPNLSVHMNEVYSELTKAIWPDKDSVIKITIGVILSLTIVSIVFILVDLACRSLLSFVY